MKQAGFLTHPGDAGRFPDPSWWSRPISWPILEKQAGFLTHPGEAGWFPDPSWWSRLVSWPTLVMTRFSDLGRIRAWIRIKPNMVKKKKYCYLCGALWVRVRGMSWPKTDVAYTFYRGFLRKGGTIQKLIVYFIWLKLTFKYWYIWPPPLRYFGWKTIGSLNVRQLVISYPFSFPS